VILLYLDASAWSKRYTEEDGRQVVDLLIEEAAAHSEIRLISSVLSYAEVISAIVRFRNRTALPDERFEDSVKRVGIDEAGFLLLPLPEDAFRSGTALIVRHNLNATDAALLWTLHDLQQASQTTGPGMRIWLVAADKRFLHAAAAEGLACLDPEVSSPREVRELLAHWAGR